MTAPGDIAAALIGGSIGDIQPVGGGRNSRVYRVRSNGTDYALKQYPPRSGDPRDRLGTEAKALRLMERHGIARVPRFLATDERHGFSLLSWLDGEPVDAPMAADIDQAAGFLASLHAHRHDDPAAALPPASEACLSGREIVRQIRARLDTLDAAGDPGLRVFLEGPFTGRLAGLVSAAERLAGFEADLPPEWRSPVPSDFGFHNVMRQADGALAFFDFEYFGWDDPVKLTADVILHPGTVLDPALRQRFRRAAEAIYGGDPGFAPRLAAYYPLFALRWALILLNEFLPNRWQQRIAAGAAEEWADAKGRQLAKAEAMLDRIGEGA
ncbi:MAG TPA: aminoglycoside phosphotransferase family protein [Alphaproteobacteria bacterium]|jgi:aminoglycoside phosphotransferase (APT) family kinase protein|nr:aminoglycoside phosphotransferase family protein [Alphaproteobacteria bacterium]